MSLNQMQAALAYLIRAPELTANQNLAETLNAYDLSASEREMLEHFSAHRLVKAFGDDMLDARWRIIHLVVRCLYPLVKEDLLKDLWRNDFEAKYVNTNFIDINIRFLEYIAYDHYAHARLTANGPEFLSDLLRYLYTIYFFSRGTLPECTEPPEHSLLSHSKFKILTINYDVRQSCSELLLIDDLKKTPLAEPADSIATIKPKHDEKIDVEAISAPATAEPLYLLFLADLERPTEFRSFEIDETLKSFLEAQSIGATAPIPECYEQLVQLGLCKELDQRTQIIAAIQSNLNEHGYYHLTEAISDDLFEDIAETLGAIVGQDDIKLYVTKRKLHSPEKLEFHTDSFISDINAWCCEIAADEGGATLLIDTYPFFAEAPSGKRELLQKVVMACPNRDHTTKTLKPLLSYNESGRPRIFYTPWFLVQSDEEAVNDASAEFKDFVDQSTLSPISIILKKGECLFIDNKRMLHGREALPENTQRHLKRLWLATGDYDKDLAE